MSVNAIKYMFRKFEKTGSLDVAPGKGGRATELAIVKEVAIATTEASANSSIATVSGRSIAGALDIPWATVRLILRKILKLLPLQDSYCATVGTARSLYLSSFCVAFSSEDENG